MSKTSRLLKRLNQIRKNTLKFVAYVLMAVIGLSFLLFGKGILPGLGTELLGATLIFFFLDVVFGLDLDNEVLDKLEHIEQNMGRNSLIDENFSKVEFTERLKSFNQLYCVGLGLDNLLQSVRNHSDECLKNQHDFRFLLIDPSSEKAKWRERMVGDFEDAIRRARHHLRQIQRMYPNKVIWKFVNYAPDYSLIIVDAKERDGIARIVLYGMIPVEEDNSGKAKRICLMIRQQNNPDLFQNLLDQFEHLWEKPNDFRAPITENLDGDNRIVSELIDVTQAKLDSPYDQTLQSGSENN